MDSVKVRLLFDGTNGVPLSGKIRVRDQDRTPCAPDIKRVLREIASDGGWPFGFKADATRSAPSRSQKRIDTGWVAEVVEAVRIT